MKPLTFIAAIAIIAGLVLLGREKRIGWLCQFAGSVLSVVHFSLISFDLSVIVLNCILGTIALLNFRKWGRKKEVPHGGPATAES